MAKFSSTCCLCNGITFVVSLPLYRPYLCSAVTFVKQLLFSLGAIVHKKQYAIKAIWWIYLILLIVIVVFKFRGSFVALSVKIATTPFGTNYNLVPFQSIMEQLSQFSEGWAKFNLLGNIVPFMPFGFLLPIVYPKLCTLKQVFICGLIFTLSIEVLQFLTRLGSFDIDDIILNMSGILFGWLLFRLNKSYR